RGAAEGLGFGGRPLAAEQHERGRERSTVQERGFAECHCHVVCLLENESDERGKPRASYFLASNETLHCVAEASHLTIYVNKDNGFTQAETVSRECPHCGAHAQLVPLATPSYEALVAARPRHVGIAYSCAACNEPRFVRAAVRAFEP